MKKITYSVIIPVYNGEKTLKRCLESLINQGREDMQIIVVSDGSTDGTDAVAAGFGKSVEFYRQPHAGVSAARNLGLAHARGDFVTFVDSDDTVAADYFAQLDRAGDEDLVIFGLNKRLRRAFRRQGLGALIRSRAIMSACDKRFRRQRIEENALRFPEGLQVGEDFCFCYLYALHVRTIGVSGAHIYHADISDDSSLSRRYRPRLEEDLCRVFAIVKQPGRYLSALDYVFARFTLSCLAERFKERDLHPLRDRAEIRAVCDCFRVPMGPSRGPVHRLLRLLLKLRADTVLYCIAWWGKGRRFQKCRKKC